MGNVNADESNGKRMRIQGTVQQSKKADSQSSRQRGGGYNRGRIGHIARNCPNPKVEKRVCNRYAMKVQLASQNKLNVREVSGEDESKAVIWGASVIDEFQTCSLQERFYENRREWASWL